MQSKNRPHVLFVAEKIYKEVTKLKKLNSEFTNKDAINKFIGSKNYLDISSGKFHDDWFKKLEKDKFIDIESKKKIPAETIRLLEIQRDMMVKQLLQFPNLYYSKSKFPLAISRRAFDHLWRICESYELWCKESNQENLITLKIIE